MITNQQIREHFKLRALGKIGNVEHDAFLRGLRDHPPVALLGEGSPAPSHLSLSDMRAAEMVHMRVDPARDDDTFAMSIVPGKIWRSMDAANQRMRDQMDALLYAAAAVISPIDAAMQGVTLLLHGEGNPYKAHFVEPEALYPEPFPYDEAMNALVGKVRERQPVDIALPIDDSEHMQLALGWRESDGDEPKRAPYVKRLETRKPRPRRAPFGINTLAPQSGFCSSGVIYGAMPNE